MSPSQELASAGRPYDPLELRGGVPVLLVVVATLFAAWSFVVPVFEAPDEPGHWQYARYLHDHWRLPLYGPDAEEANSPPLYYALMAPVAAPSATPPFVLVQRPDGSTISLAPPRSTLNTDRDLGRYWPLRLARLATAALSVVTVWICYRLGLAATGSRTTGLITAILVGLLPQFAFRAMNVSNDSLLVLCSAGVTLGVVRIVREGFTWRLGLRTSALLAAAYLSKISAIALVVPVAYALLRGKEPLASRLRQASVLLLALVVVLPWSVRNVLLYGDPFASGAMRTAVAHLITDRPLLSSYFLYEFPLHLSTSFIGIFGWMNVRLPIWMYVFFAALFFLAAVGLVIGIVRASLSFPLVLALLLTVGSALAVVVNINLSFTQPQGRYLFGALPAIALLAALGFESLPGGIRSLLRPSLVGAVLLALDVHALIDVVAPAYYPPPERDLGGSARQLYPVSVADLVPLDRTGEFTIHGPDPMWILPADVDAKSYDAAEIELAADWSSTPRRGCLYFARPDAPFSLERQVCFDWLADGSVQRFEVAIAPHPEWFGRIAAVRIDPVEEGIKEIEGSPIRLVGVRLIGRPGGHSGSSTSALFVGPR